MDYSVRSSCDPVQGAVGGSVETIVAASPEVPGKTSCRSFSYTAERVVGNGSFGVVYQAVSADSNEVVAIKKVFQDRRYKNREFEIMKELGRHPNIVALHHAFYTNGEKPEELFLNVVMEFVPETIHRLLKTFGKSRKQIPIIQTKLYIHQLCRGLAFVHASGVCHRDIKPQNLLICPKTHALKLCDFGSAKRLLPNEPNVSYICSRYYRAPELIFGAVNYSHSLDNWSMGCVLGELVLGTPLFQGENGVDQLVQIVKMLGTPTTQQLLAMNPNYTEFKFPQIKASPWSKILKGNEAGGLDVLLEGMLRYDPGARFSSAEIMASPWFDELRDRDFVVGPSGDRIETDFLFNFTESEKTYLNRQFRDRMVGGDGGCGVEELLTPKWYPSGGGDCCGTGDRTRSRSSTTDEE